MTRQTHYCYDHFCFSVINASSEGYRSVVGLPVAGWQLSGPHFGDVLSRVGHFIVTPRCFQAHFLVSKLILFNLRRWEMRSLFYNLCLCLTKGTFLLSLSSCHIHTLIFYYSSMFRRRWRRCMRPLWKILAG